MYIIPSEAVKVHTVFIQESKHTLSLEKSFYVQFFVSIAPKMFCNPENDPNSLSQYGCKGNRSKKSSFEAQVKYTGSDIIGTHLGSLFMPLRRKEIFYHNDVGL